MASIFKNSSRANNTLTSNQIKQLETNLRNATTYINDLVKHEDSVICFGSMKSGKSSVINYLLGNALKGVQKTFLDPISIELMDSNCCGPTIGLTAASSTPQPKKYNGKLINLNIWDIPGFTDSNHGVIQDITNAFYIHELFIKLKSAIIVLICDIDDILRHGIDKFLLLLKSCETLLGKEILNFKNGISIIFTKTEEKFNDHILDANLIKRVIKHKIDGQKSLDVSDTIKSLINYFVKSDENCIGIFPLAKVNKNPYKILNSDLETVILSRQPFDSELLKKVSPIISAETNRTLLLTRDKLCSQKHFDKVLNNFKDTFKQLFKEWDENINQKDIGDDELTNLTAKLVTLNDKFKNFENSTDKSVLEQLVTLAHSDSETENIIVELELKLKSTFLEFLDRLLDTKYCDIFKNVFKIHYDWIELELSRRATKLEEKSGNCTEEDAESIFSKIDLEIQQKFDDYEKENQRLKEINRQKNLGIFLVIGHKMDRAVDNVFDFVTDVGSVIKKPFKK